MTTSWVKWPGDSVDPQFGLDALEPSDETLERTIINSQVLAAGLTPGTIDPVMFVIGLIAFDGGGAPGFYEGAIFDPTGASLVFPPQPIDAHADWIIRQPFIFNSVQSYQGPGADIFIQSRAKRKLPPGRGILVVAQYFDLTGNAGNTSFAFGMDVRLAVKSGYTR